jgi:AbrB family looped-hinge helix DNA binding protein
MRVTSKGQVTIPIELRERFGLLPDTEVEFQPAGNGVRIHKARRGSGRGKRVVDRLRGRGDVKLSTDEILALTRR